MRNLTIIVEQQKHPPTEGEIARLLALAPVAAVFTVGAPPVPPLPSWQSPAGRHRHWEGSIHSGATLRAILENVKTPLALLLTAGVAWRPLPNGLERMLAIAEETKAPLLYADYHLLQGRAGRTAIRLNTYQLGSVREDFDFGPALLLGIPPVRRLSLGDAFGRLRYGALYALRLRLALKQPLLHLREFLYETTSADADFDIFAYQDAANVAAQGEYEHVFSEYLRQSGAFIEADGLQGASAFPLTASQRFPVEMSVVIPVKDRLATIAVAIHSAAAQETTFPFNIIVVDNHSQDGSSDIIANLARSLPHLCHIVPKSDFLSIGGCWNEALFSPACGRYAVQLDSDDIYADNTVLQRIYEKFQEGDYAAVIGSYTIVDKDGRVLAPGLISHREWTDANGHNNALRINGLGAPRAFHTVLARCFGFPNVGYGEDYAMCLRFCREYRIGRIFENLYLCRRWEGNTDSGIGRERKGENDAYKDHLRTLEIMARQSRNAQLTKAAYLLKARG